MSQLLLSRPRHSIAAGIASGTAMPLPVACGVDPFLGGFAPPRPAHPAPQSRAHSYSSASAPATAAGSAERRQAQGQAAP
jgi:hypothetical protein